MVGRETGWASFRVCRNTKKETLQEILTEETNQEACIFTDENRSYLWLEGEEESRERKAVNHSKGWAEDRDGDGKMVTENGRFTSTQSKASGQA